MKKDFTIHSLFDMPKVAADFLLAIKPAKIVAFHGPMGIGKTTFIKAIGNVLGVNDVMNSPTFSIVNEYDTANEGKIYHFDFYRLKKADEAFDLGIEDYFCSGDYCFMEWPENISEILPSDCLHVYLSELSDGTRNISLIVE